MKTRKVLWSYRVDTPLIYVSDTDDMRLVFVCVWALTNHLMRLESEIALLISVGVRWELLWPTTMTTTTKLNVKNKARAGWLVMRVLLYCRGKTDIT